MNCGLLGVSPSDEVIDPLYGYQRVPGLKVHWDFSDEATRDVTGGRVSRLYDKTSNGYNLHSFNNTGPVLSPRVKNGLDVGTFSSSLLRTIAKCQFGNFTWLFVQRATANGLVLEHSTDAASLPGAYVYTSTGYAFYVNRAGASSQLDIALNWLLGNTWRIVAVRSGTGIGISVHINGVLVGSNAALPISSTQALADIYLGARSNNTVMMAGDIGEVKLYDSYLSNAALAIAVRDMNAKWGVYT